jgi:hypothetical protein
MFTDPIARATRDWKGAQRRSIGKATRMQMEKASPNVNATDVVAPHHAMKRCASRFSFET